MLNRYKQGGSPQRDNSTNMTSYCDVINKTGHLQHQIDLNKVGDHPWRFYDEIVHSSRDSTEKTLLSR